MKKIIFEETKGGKFWAELNHGYLVFKIHWKKETTKDTQLTLKPTEVKKLKEFI